MILIPKYAESLLASRVVEIVANVAYCMILIQASIKNIEQEKITLTACENQRLINEELRNTVDKLSRIEL